MTHSPILLVANWKMHGDAARVRAWATAVDAVLAPSPEVACVFCPPMPYVAAAGARTHLKLGAQNCHAAEQGAFTGESSAAMLRDLGCSHVIVGHSERRAMGETDADILAKAQAAIAAGLVPIVCVGESHAQYTSQQTAVALQAQVEPLRALAAGSYVIAYEPIWAIGTACTPTGEEIQAAHRVIKSVLGSATSVLYGGSVNAANLEKILALPEVSGALIGGASLDITSMCAMIQSAQTIRK